MHWHPSIVKQPQEEGLESGQGRGRRRVLFCPQQYKHSHPVLGVDLTRYLRKSGNVAKSVATADWLADVWMRRVPARRGASWVSSALGWSRECLKGLCKWKTESTRTHIISICPFSLPLPLAQWRHLQWASSVVLRAPLRCSCGRAGLLLRLRCASLVAIARQRKRKWKKANQGELPQHGTPHHPPPPPPAPSQLISSRANSARLLSCKIFELDTLASRNTHALWAWACQLATA